MADKKISQLTGATTPLAGTEVLPIVQSGSTVKVSSDDLTVKNVRSNATTGILQVAGPGAGATRTMTVPDANFTAARSDAGQTFSGQQTFGGGVNVTGGKVQSVYGAGGDFVALFQNTTSATPYGVWIKDAAAPAAGYPLLNITSGDGATVYMRVDSDNGNAYVGKGNLAFNTSGNGIIDGNGNEQIKFTTTASAVNEFTIKNAATGALPQLAVTGGDTNIGMDLAAKGSGGFAFNGASRRFVRTGTNGDTTVAATISFVSQGNGWISQLVEFRVALSSSLGSSVHGGVVRYILSSLDSGSGLASITALASDLTGVTAATSSSGNDLTVTFTITGGGNAIRYGIEADVLSSNGAGWYATGMSVA